MLGIPQTRNVVTSSEKGVRLAQKELEMIQVGPCSPVGVYKLEKAEVGPTIGPTWLFSHFSADRGLVPGDGVDPAV